MKMEPLSLPIAKVTASYQKRPLKRDPYEQAAKKAADASASPVIPIIFLN